MSCRYILATENVKYIYRQIQDSDAALSFRDYLKLKIISLKLKLKILKFKLQDSALSHKSYVADDVNSLLKQVCLYCNLFLINSDISQLNWTFILIKVYLTPGRINF